MLFNLEPKQVSLRKVINDGIYYIVVLYSVLVFKVTSQYCHPNYNVTHNFLLYEINRRKCWRILYFPY